MESHSPLLYILIMPFSEFDHSGQPDLKLGLCEFFVKLFLVSKVQVHSSPPICLDLVRFIPTEDMLDRQMLSCSLEIGLATLTVFFQFLLDLQIILVQLGIPCIPVLIIKVTLMYDSISDACLEDMFWKNYRNSRIVGMKEHTPHSDQQTQNSGSGHRSKLCRAHPSASRSSGFAS